ncbi:MAG: glycosyltransferase family 39 protein [Candidatus Levybacteria bacterium]|nr:glycosyltransferase family 39 protein [Candidatus Levybacteria bacterium]
MMVFLLILIGGFFRFYNLDWGSPFYFHPDERNIASSVLQINFPNQMNPHFFAYGSFPIYLIYFTAFFLNLVSKSQLTFEQALIISRFYSAILSVLLIPSIYYIGSKLANKNVGLIAAVFCTFSVGLIQFSHFGTFEIWLTFLGLWLFYFSLKLLKQLDFKDIITVGLISGLLAATKISSLPLLMIPMFSILISYLSHNKLFKHILYGLSLIFISCILFYAVSPYVFLDTSSFIASMRHESSVALGTLSVFYTGGFFNSIPVIFQFTKIYPFLLNPALTILFIPSLIYVIYFFLKKRHYPQLLVVACFLLLFFSQAFLFAKWTRYILPTLPFVYLIIAIFIDKFINKKILQIIFLICIVFSCSYFIDSFARKDTRIQASLWAKENIPSSSRVLSEVYDLGIVPFNQYLPNISLFNFYDLDQTPDKPLELDKFLLESGYIILPSQRIIQTRMMNKDEFPNGYKFYNELINEKLGYKKVYETSCDLFCKIIYLGDPVFSFEETANVFDRPTVFIFKRM